MATTQKRGRPRINLTLARKNRICREVALGKSLRTVLKGKDMPTMGKVMDLLQEDAAFAEQYARSKKAGIEIHIDGIIDLADTATDKNAHAVRLKVDTRKWVASKLAPKLYGDKIGLDVQAEVKHIDATTPQGLLEGARRIAFVLAKAARIAGEAPAPMKLLPHEVSVP